MEYKFYTFPAGNCKCIVKITKHTEPLRKVRKSEGDEQTWPSFKLEWDQK